MSFESQLKWMEYANLLVMMKKWKRMMSTDLDVDPSTAMKRIIKNSAIIIETVEQHLEEMMESENDED